MITKIAPQRIFFLGKVSMAGPEMGFTKSAVMVNILATIPTTVEVAPKWSANLEIRVFIINWPKFMAMFTITTLRNSGFQIFVGG